MKGPPMGGKGKKDDEKDDKAAEKKPEAPKPPMGGDMKPPGGDSMPKPPMGGGGAGGMPGGDMAKKAPGGDMAKKAPGADAVEKGPQGAAEAPQKQAGKAASAAPAGGGQSQSNNQTVNIQNSPAPQGGGGQSPQAGQGGGQDPTAEVMKTAREALKELGPIVKEGMSEAGKTSRKASDDGASGVNRKHGANAAFGDGKGVSSGEEKDSKKENAPPSTMAQPNAKESKKDVGMGNQAPKVGQEESPDKDNKNKNRLGG